MWLQINAEALYNLDNLLKQSPDIRTKVVGHFVWPEFDDFLALTVSQNLNSNINQKPIE